MKKIISLGFAAFLLIFWAHISAIATYAAKPALLFILDGQSNAGPHANGDQVAASWKQVVPDTLINPQKVRSDFNDSVAQAWIVANPYAMRSEKFGIANTGFGPELTFIKTLKPYFPNHILAVAQRSLGGTSIVAWDKDHSTPAWRDAMSRTHGAGQLPKPPQYPELMELKQQAVASLNDREDVSSVTVAGLLWVQNEQDTGSTYGAEHYEENLRKLVQNVRADWGLPRLPFMFVNAHNHEGTVNAERVDAAVEAVKNSEPKTAVINTKDLGVHPAPDLVHYNTNGTVELGIRFANAFMNIYDANSSPLPSPSSSPRARPSPSATPRISPTPRPSTSPSPRSSPITFELDFNNDGVVNNADMSLLIQKLKKPIDAIFDIDENGSVNGLDFAVLAKNI